MTINRKLSPFSHSVDANQIIVPDKGWISGHGTYPELAGQYGAWFPFVRNQAEAGIW